MRILLIKLTSLGDLLHALPALSDAYQAFPEIEFDWVIDESFQEVATWHPAIKSFFITNHRKWRKNFFHFKTFTSILRLIKTLRQTSYDLVIDGQGNYKSSLLSLCTKGITAGYDRNSIREKIASFFYQKTYSISLKDHAIDRLRQLFSKALNYPLPSSPPNFHILTERFVPPSLKLPPSYLVFIHSASWNTKLWPEAHWIGLIKKITEQGNTILLPWGNAEERQRAERLAISPLVVVLPKLKLSELGYIIAKAKACVSMDTGLSHLIAALHIPSVTLYGATDSGLIGSSGDRQCHIQSKLHCAPCTKRTCRFPGTTLNPPCLAQITPDTVFKKLLSLM